MDGLEESVQLEHLRADCIALEVEAGIDTVMEQAREGRFIPLGTFGEKTTPQEYFADEHDHLRSQTRDAYFSVENKELRIKLIYIQRTIENLLRQLLEKEKIKANKAFDAASTNSQTKPWVKAALVSIFAVAFGYWVYGIVGAIAGAVGGFFLGQGVIWQQQKESKMSLSQAENNMEEAENEKYENALMPEFFSYNEESTGEHDTNLDGESGYANLLQAQKSG